MEELSKRRRCNKPPPTTRTWIADIPVGTVKEADPTLVKLMTNKIFIQRFSTCAQMTVAIAVGFHMGAVEASSN